ncbi:MAG: amidohydrolase family protein [Candidatus Binatus sp.]|uniref:amidohydrolase family protein n=1 Tax=Candidatus Binatus sp. TaxID=2811406 RepID=UPI0027202DD5|nr:amidohydrolase family protein [Candidatus Binatus sp.]MDO8431828.1 amidohydrolase family protein [Candidatus Binatus sp.]
MSIYTIIDADTHVTETPDLWTSRAPAHMRDSVPRVITDSRGTHRWVLAGGRNLASAGMTATAGRGTFKNPPKTYEEMHPGAYDAKARLKYMDQMGIWAMVMYPNVGGFGAQQFLKLNDPELMLTCVQIYNDWQTEWASADSRRLIPITSIPFWDVAAAVTEVRRCAAIGHKGILFTGEPQYYGLPLLGDKHWSPLWEAAVELDLPISFHIGSGDMAEGLVKERVATYGKMAAFTELAVDIFLRNGLQLNDLLMSGVLARFPKIKFVSVESGIGWIPFVLEAMDYQFKGNSVAEEHPEFDRLPSEYFARNVYACYWFEQTAPRRLIDKIGVDNILFETDFPHPTSLYGDEVHARIKGGLSDCEESVRRKILWGNAQKLYKVTGPSADDEAKL